MNAKKLRGLYSDGITLDNFQVDCHRNGIAGTGFHIVTFDSDENGNTSHMMAVVFPDDGNCAVFNRDLIGQGEIRFFYNSFRGDVYESALREVIKEWHAEGMPVVAR